MAPLLLGKEHIRKKSGTNFSGTLAFHRERVYVHGMKSKNAHETDWLLHPCDLVCMQTARCGVANVTAFFILLSSTISSKQTFEVGYGESL